MMPSEAMRGANILRPSEIVGRVPIRPTIFAESVAISGEALLIGLVVLLVLAVLGILGIAALVYLGARLAAGIRRQNAGEVRAGASRGCAPASEWRTGTEPNQYGTATGEEPAQDVIPAVPYDPTGRRHRAPRSPRRPMAAWLWVVCTLVSVGVIVALPGIWYIGPLAAPFLGAAGAELTRKIDERPFGGKRFDGKA